MSTAPNNGKPAIRLWIDPVIGSKAECARYAAVELLELAGWRCEEVSSIEHADLVHTAGFAGIPAGAVVIHQAMPQHWDFSRTEVRRLGRWPIPSGAARDTDHLDWEHVDILLAAAYFLTGGPEFDAQRNPVGVPLGASMTKWGIEAGPILNELAEWFGKKLHAAFPERSAAPRWPRGKRWAVCLTHDCDQPYRWAVRATLIRCSNRWAAGEYRAMSYLLGKSAYAVAQKLRADPHVESYRRWLAIEAELGIRGCYYFAAWSMRDKASHQNDCGYRIEDTVVQRVIRMLLDAGMEIGLHASIRARDVPGRFAEEVDRFFRATARRPMGVRHHYWALAPQCPEETLARQHSEGNLLYDSSFGLNDIPGFRRGIALPFHPYGMRRSEFLELPPTLMDGAVFAVKRPPEECREMIRRHFEIVRESKGLAMLDWHDYVMAPNTLNGAGPRLVECLRDVAADSSCWFASPVEIRRWWLNDRWQTSRSP